MFCLLQCAPSQLKDDLNGTVTYVYWSLICTGFVYVWPPTWQWQDLNPQPGNNPTGITWAAALITLPQRPHYGAYNALNSIANRAPK